MAKKLIETIRGNRHKFDIYRNDEFLSYHFVVYRDGEYWKGTFSTLPAAVKAVEKAG